VFERYVVVDWSANSTPKRGRDSIWVVVRDPDGCRLENPPTRAAAVDLLDDVLATDCGPTLVGVDFSLGYPAGTARALQLEGPPWAATAHLLAGMIDDRPDNGNNRFDVAAQLNRLISGASRPFWGCPPSRVTATLRPTKPETPGPLAEWRAVEERLRAEGRRPFSSWQLTGAGAVGSQSLLGIPLILRLIGRLPGRVDVWPFTTGLRAPTLRAGSIVVAEVWPSMHVAEPHGGQVRDAAQVAATVAWLADRDGEGTLAEMFAPPVDHDVRQMVELEEGWVLGVGP
jgi:hypothetical protein